MSPAPAAHAGRNRTLPRAKSQSRLAITFSRAPSPELPAKLKAMQAAGRVDIDLVLTGPALVGRRSSKALDGIAARARGGASETGGTYTRPRSRCIRRSPATGPAVAYSPSGSDPAIRAERAGKAPTTAAELLDWTRARPNKFF